MAAGRAAGASAGGIVLAVGGLYVAQSVIGGWGFDVEVLFVAQRSGLHIAEVPIAWYFDPDSRVHPIWDTLGMVVDVVRIRARALAGGYQPVTSRAAITTDAPLAR